MRKLYKLTAVIAVFLIAMTFFCTVAHAEPAEEPTETPIESVTETPEPPEEEFNIGDIPPGVGTVVDVFHDEIGRKFYTIQTPAGNTFYLIIDFTRQNENVYFLDAVNERDLLALAEKGDNAQPGGNISAIPDPNGNNTSDPPGNPTDPKPEPTDNGSNFMTLLVVLVVLIGGGAGYYFKIYRKKKDNEIRDEYEDEPDDYAGDDYETEPEDDSPPWEEDEDV